MYSHICIASVVGQVLAGVGEYLSLYEVPIGLTGLGLIIMAWLIENADRIPLVEKVVFARYYLVMKALKKLELEKVLEPCDQGFSQLSEILEEKIQEPANPQIAKIELVKSAGGISFGTSRAEVGNLMTLRITLTNSISGEGTVTNINIRDIIGSRYRGGPQRSIATALFWIGLLIELALVFV